MTKKWVNQYLCWRQNRSLVPPYLPLAPTEGKTTQTSYYCFIIKISTTNIIVTMALVPSILSLVSAKLLAIKLPQSTWPSWSCSVFPVRTATAIVRAPLFLTSFLYQRVKVLWRLHPPDFNMSSRGGTPARLALLLAAARVLPAANSVVLTPVCWSKDLTQQEIVSLDAGLYGFLEVMKTLVMSPRMVQCCDNLSSLPGCNQNEENYFLW